MTVTTFSIPPDLLPWMIEHRRHLHSVPEVGIALPETHDYLQAQLRDLGFSPEVHRSAGVTVRIPGLGGSGAVRVLRADMDALPVTEPSGASYASTRDGAMHACGHDLHMAMLLGVARILSERPPRHDVVLAFQPGEETDHGALQTLGHRNLHVEGDVTAFAIHVNAALAAHSVNYRLGTFMANGDWFRASFHGEGGHASAPDLTGSPIEALASFVGALHSLTRTLTAAEDVVATVTEVIAGNSVNVIPTNGTLRGTIRTLSSDQRALLLDGMERITQRSAELARTLGKLDVIEGYPAVVSHSGYLRRLLDLVERSPLADHLTEMDHASMVIEDFAYFLHRWPGAMVYLGANVNGATAFNHSAEVVFDEDVMSTGVAMHLLATEVDL